MKLTKVSTGIGDVVEIYTVEEISEEDIPPPSERFRKFVRELSDFPLLNVFTMGEFMKQVRKRFVTKSVS